MSKFGMSLFAGLMLLGAVACDDGVADTAQNTAICSRACEKLKGCTGNDDKGECLDKDDSCVQKALKCAPECAGVTAVSAST
jgi:hypothetical protein